jgi:hypothetical protein
MFTTWVKNVINVTEKVSCCIHSIHIYVYALRKIFRPNSEKCLNCLMELQYIHCESDNKFTHMCKGARGGAVVEALRYKPEGRGIDSR